MSWDPSPRTTAPGRRLSSATPVGTAQVDTQICQERDELRNVKCITHRTKSKMTARAQCVQTRSFTSFQMVPTHTCAHHTDTKKKETKQWTLDSGMEPCSPVVSLMLQENWRGVYSNGLQWVCIIHSHTLDPTCDGFQTDNSKPGNGSVNQQLECNYRTHTCHEFHFTGTSLAHCWSRFWWKSTDVFSKSSCSWGTDVQMTNEDAVRCANSVRYQDMLMTWRQSTAIRTCCFMAFLHRVL